MLILNIFILGKPLAPKDFVLVSKSYRQLRISFEPNLDGGREQTITLEKSLSDKLSEFKSTNHWIKLPRNNNTKRVFTLSNLRENTNYFLRLKADNDIAGPPAYTEVKNFTTSGLFGNHFCCY